MTRGIFRREYRISVEWLIQAALQDERPLRGQIYDASLRGIFFQPDKIDLSRSADAYRDADERPFRLILCMEGGLIVETEARLRWSGHSRRHGCWGLGAQFAQIPTELEAWYATSVQRVLAYNRAR